MNDIHIGVNVLLLVLSLVAMVLGPVLYSLLSRGVLQQKVLDTVVVFAMTAILAIEVIPDAWKTVNWLAFVWLLVGFALPAAAEYTFKRFAHEAHILTLILAVVGMALHSFVDGVAVTHHGEHGDTQWLAIAVILHRLPVSAAIWWLIRPQFGAFYAAAVIVLMMAATGFGYFGGERLLSPLSPAALAYFQMIIAGLILHVLLNKPHADHQH